MKIKQTTGAIDETFLVLLCGLRENTQAFPLSVSFEPGLRTSAVVVTQNNYFLKYDDCLFNPLNPKIKVSVLICCPYTFPIEVVGGLNSRNHSVL